MAEEQKTTTPPQQDPVVDAASPESPAAEATEMSTIETLEKIMDALSHDFVDAFNKNELDNATLSNRQRKKAMDPIIEDMSKKLGISQDNLRKVASYLRLDITKDDAAYQQDMKKKLNGILDVMKSHLPEGAIDQATVDAWKQKVEEAAKTLEALQGEWNGLAASKASCELERKQCEQTLAELDGKLKAAERKLEEIQAQLEQKRADLKAALDSKDNGTLIQELADDIAKFSADVERQKAAIEDARASMSEAQTDLATHEQELADIERDLQQKTFDVRAAMMVCALQENMQDAIKHMPLLDDKTQEAQELVEDVKTLSQDYEDLAKQYKGHRLDWGEALQRHDNFFLQKIGDALIDWKIADIQLGNEIATRSAFAKIAASAEWDKFRLDVGGIFNKTSSKNIQWHSDKAMKELAKINKLDARIQRQTARAEKQAMREMRRELGGRRMSRSAIEQSPAYKEKVAELTKMRTARTRAKKEQHVQKFQKQYNMVKERTDKRKEVLQKHEQSLAALNRRIDVMREFGDIRGRADFTRDASFAQDLQQLLPKNMRQVSHLQEAAQRFEQSHDDGHERG